MDWTTKMFLAAVVGSFAGLIWPILIAIFRKKTSDIYKLIGINRVVANLQRSVLSTLSSQTQAAVFGSIVGVIASLVVFLVIALVIAVIAAAVGFAAFLQDETTRIALKNLGTLGYFSAISYGFSAASLVEEGLKK